MLNVCYSLSKMKKRAAHKDTEGSVIYKAWFPTAVSVALKDIYC